MSYKSRYKEPKDEIGLAFDKIAKGTDALFALELSLPADKVKILDRAPWRLPRFIQLKIQTAENEIDGGWKILHDRQEASRAETDRAIARLQESMEASKVVIADARQVLAEPAP